MNHQQKLKSFRKKLITKDELSALLSIREDSQLYNEIHQLEEQGILSSVKSSGTNGNRLYPIFMKYRITVPKESYEADLAEIAQLHPGLLRIGYLTEKPEQYHKYRAMLQALNRWMFSDPDLTIPISRKERSFEIFNQEKVLDDHGIFSLSAAGRGFLSFSIARMRAFVKTRAEKTGIFDSPLPSAIDFRGRIWYNYRDN